ncbi:MAG TPA: hypothetical protein VFE23_07915 [Usitatibacter sp.]|jgi:hypothetical protein|nr:hypothetical protein [Usitatibacter sp.]
MTKTLLRLIVLVTAFLCVPLAANAQAFRAYLASYGNDANPCTVGAPCRLLPAALNAIVPGGEVWMLDSANYNAGTVTITTNANIMAVPGQVGSIVAVAGSPAVIIGAGLSVSFKNVYITNNANNPGTDGIQMTTGTLSVQDSVFAVSSNGIFANGAANVSVHQSMFRGGFRGIFVQDGAKADVSSSKFASVGYSLVAFAAGTATTTTLNIRDCAITGGTTGVVSAGELSGATVRVTVHNSTVSNASYAFLAGGDVSGSTAVLSVANSAATLSGVGMYQYGAGAVLESLGNNLVRGNGTNISGVVTTVSGS